MKSDPNYFDLKDPDIDWLFRLGTAYHSEEDNVLYLRFPDGTRAPITYFDPLGCPYGHKACLRNIERLATRRAAAASPKTRRR